MSDFLRVYYGFRNQCLICDKQWNVWLQTAAFIPIKLDNGKKIKNNIWSTLCHIDSQDALAGIVDVSPSVQRIALAITNKHPCWTPQRLMPLLFRSVSSGDLHWILGAWGHQHNGYFKWKMHSKCINVLIFSKWRTPIWEAFAALSKVQNCKLQSYPEQREAKPVSVIH